MIATDFGDFVQQATWQYARTMPTIPHDYTLRKWHDADTFDAAVQFIRDFGVVKPWGHYRHTYYEFDGYHYWTMGAPVAETILINRERLIPATYDDIAPAYDLLFVTPDAQRENEQVYARLQPYLDGSVLDMGCGTGLLLDLHGGPLPDYMGLDPSEKMLERLREKHPLVGQMNLQQVPAEQYGQPSQQLVVALFGAASNTD
jgi:hypothetical protein